VPPAAAAPPSATAPPAAAPPSAPRIPALRAAALGALALAVVGTAIAVTRVERSGGPGPAQGASPGRLVSAQSNRFVYWRVAAAVFAEHPLHGIGSGAFGVEWLQRRDVAENVRDAHSLYLETAAELGIVGLAALAAFLAGTVQAARRVTTPAAIAALAAFALHAGLDWDWELPALSLVAILLAARVIAAAEP
jgi:O-antigen ligase